MALKDDLTLRVKSILNDKWTYRKGQVVPLAGNVLLKNDGVQLDAAILYADIRNSTKMVDHYVDWAAASIYKGFLHCAARIIRSEGGTISAYDGDRIMAVFIGDRKCHLATRAAFKINWATKNIFQKEWDLKYPNDDLKMQQTCGIDRSPILVANEGIRGFNDLVWVGRAANYAAKLTGMSAEYPTWITKDIYDYLPPNFVTHLGLNVWKPWTWNEMNGLNIYSSTYWSEL